jgi:hypothetical protein
MNAPLVVVQGDLLLPTLFPLAGMPNAVYGEEWTLTSARPALTEYEIPFYAARFVTAYVSPFSVRNDRFPYTPASLWGKFRRNDETLQSAQGIPPVASDVTPPAAEPAPFAFEPFSAPDDRYVKTPPANRDHRKQLAGGAIALACAAFIAWALFGTKIGRQDPDAQTAKLALSATPVIKPAQDSVKAPGASAATVVVASSAASSTVSSVASSATATAALPAVQKPVVASGNGKPAANASVIASNSRPATLDTASVRATKSRPVAQTLERDQSKRGKGKSLASGKREAHRYEVVHRRHGHEYQGTPVYRSSGYDTPLASPARRTLSREDSRANTASSSLSVADMYSMLAHSAVLDDNSGAARQTVRAAPLASPRVSSGSSSDTSNWNSGISQNRVTDAPSQFYK